MRKSIRHVQGRLQCVLSVVVLAMAIISVPQKSYSQKVAVTKFTGKGAKKLDPLPHEALARTLSDTGLKTVTWRKYKAKAAKLGFKIGPARKPEGIAAVSSKLGLTAVVNGHCRFQRKKKRTRCNISVFNPEGALISNKRYKFKGRQVIPPDQLETMTDNIVASIHKSPKTEEAQTSDDNSWKEQESPAEEPMATEPTETWAEEEGDRESGYSDNKESRHSNDDDIDLSPKRRQVGAMSDLLIAVGAGLNHRTGLDPKHVSGLFPAIRTDVHFFLGTFTDIVVLRDIGFGGSFNIDINLKYGFKDEKKEWDSLQLQWRTELIYRLAFLNDVVMKPAFVIRGGYGSTMATIDADDSIEAAKSVSYVGPHAGMDIYLMLFDPVLRFRFGGGMLFAISTGKELDGDASGFYLDSGFDVVIPHWLHMSVGWEMTRFKIDDKQMGEVTDLYNNMYLRLGWNFDSANFD